MPAPTVTLWVDQGASWAYAVAISSDVVDQTWRVRAQVRRCATDDRILHSWTTEAGNAVLAAAVVDGATVTTLTLTATPADSTAWDWSKGDFDVVVESPDGVTRHRVLQGEVKVSRGVTR